MANHEYGWNGFFENHFAPYQKQNFIAGRIVREDRGQYSVITEYSILKATVPGRMIYGAHGREDFPVIGDWVVLSRDNSGTSIIQAVLPRQTKLSRKEAGKKDAEQVLAANFDLLLVAVSLHMDFNPRKIERLMVLAWDSGATPVLVLTKADLVEDMEVYLAQAETAAVGAKILTLSAVTGEGMQGLTEILKPGKTAALIGSSGAGKSTLINAILGRDLLKTGEIRESDGRGKHITTWREIIQLPNGSLIMDHPGIREAGLWTGSTAVEHSFEDIHALAESCRYRDCRHMEEPDCAVKKALKSGTLDHKRFLSFQKLLKEARYIETRDDYRARFLEKDRWKKISRLQRTIKKDNKE